MAIKIKITQTKSGIGRTPAQRKTLEGLGLGKLHRSVVLQDTPALRGMIVRISHLVTIQAVE